MPPVRRHRIGDQLPAVVHPGPDPAATDLCRDLVAHTNVEAVVLFGSRAIGGWDEQSDLDMIGVHSAADDSDDRSKALGRTLADLKECHYSGYRDYDSPHHGVVDGLMIETTENYHAYRRTLNHVIARAAREGRVFTRDPGAEDSYRHDGDVSNEWDLVTLERFKRVCEEAGDLDYVRRSWLDRSRLSPVLNAMRGRNAHGLLWDSGAALLSILGVIYPRDSVAETAAAIARHDAGGATPSGATWTASTSIPAAVARWWSPIPSTTSPPCGAIWKSTGVPSGNASASSAGTTCTRPAKVPALDREPHRPRADNPLVLQSRLPLVG